MKQPKGSWTIPGRAGLSVWLQTLHCVTSSFISDFAVGLRGESAKILSLSFSEPLAPPCPYLSSKFNFSFLYESLVARRSPLISTLHVRHSRFLCEKVARVDAYLLLESPTAE